MQSALQSGVHQSQLGMWQKFTDQGPLQKVFLPNTAIDLQIPILRRLVSISSSIGWVFCISMKWSNIQRNWECSQKRSLKASIERTVSVNNESGVSKGIQRNGILCRKLFWPTVRKKCFRDQNQNLGFLYLIEVIEHPTKLGVFTKKVTERQHWAHSLR